MLTLTGIRDRIEQLEAEEFGDGGPFSKPPWQRTVQWALLYIRSENPHQDKLDPAHPLNEYFTNPFLLAHPLPVRPEVWGHRYDYYEECQLEFILMVVEYLLENGYDEEAIISQECFEEVCRKWREEEEETARLSIPFYQERNRRQFEHAENLQKYRYAAQQGAVSSEGAEWLRENDKDFLENLRAKNNQPDIDTLLTSLMSRVAQPPKVQKSQPVAPAPVAQPIQPTREVIEAIWTGLEVGSFEVTLSDGRSVPVYRNRVYPLSRAAWDEIQTGPEYFRVRWERVNA